MENKNMTPFYGTLTGSPVTLTPHFGRAKEWLVHNLDTENSYTFTLSGTTVNEIVPPGNKVTNRIESDAITISGTGDYAVICSEVPGSVQIIEGGG